MFMSIAAVRLQAIHILAYACKTL